LDDTYVVRHDPEKHRFSVDLGEDTAVLDYTRSGDTIVLAHTGVPKAFEHRGIAGELARTALEFAKSEGLRVIPRCKYVQAYLTKHPEYAPLVVTS
jgi:predicted GNAT family acetyltransferase